MAVLLGFRSVHAVAEPAPPQPGTSDELGEAEGLAPSAAPGAANGLEQSASQAPTSPNWRWRAYGLIDHRLVETSGARASKASYGVNAEAGLTADVELPKHNQVYVDALLASEEEAQGRQSRAYLNQGGWRYRPHDKVLLVLGKERSRRAPAVMVSPSDFIHSNQSLPGMREDRSGVWLARATWQDQEFSMDAIGLLCKQENDQGLPRTEEGTRGQALRLFRRNLWSGFDLGIDLGRADDRTQAGTFVQTIFGKVWKTYVEAGFKQQDAGPAARSALIGLSYEGVDDWSLRLEQLYKNQQWLMPLPPLKDQRALILSLQGRELGDAINVSWSLVQSLEQHAYAHITRLEWLASDHQILGLSGINLYPERPFKNQISADWRYNF